MRVLEDSLYITSEEVHTSQQSDRGAAATNIYFFGVGDDKEAKICVLSEQLAMCIGP